MKKQKFSRVWYVVGILAAANLAVWTGLGTARSGSFGKLYFFDVGQGDAVYFRTPQGNDILIDGGPGDVVLSKLGRVMPFNDRTIEFVILTHPHADHASGLVELLKRFAIREVMLPDVDYDSATYQVLLQELQKREVKISRPKLGQRVFLDNLAVLDIFFPLASDWQTYPGDINDVSVVARLALGQSQVLLTGDAGKNIEQLLLKFKLPMESEILKVGHHGSRHSTDPQFAGAVKPQYSIISVGENRYGHPHPETLKTLESVPTLRTDQEGDIAFEVYQDKVLLKD